MIDFFSEERRAYRQNKKAEKLRKDQKDRQLKLLLQTYVGRAVLWSVLEKCGIYQENFDPDARKEAWLLGRRSIGLEILVEICNLSPNAYTKMSEEAAKRAEDFGMKGEKNDYRDDADQSDFDYLDPDDGADGPA